MSETERKPRVIRTPAEIAQSEVDKARQRVEKAGKRVEKAEAELTAAKAEAERAASFLDYASKNPDLPAQPADESDGEVGGTDDGEIDDNPVI